MQDLKDLKRFFHVTDRGGNPLACACGMRGPRATVKKSVPFSVGRGPVPRRASICTGNGLGLRAVFARVERSRGTGPRATGPEGVRLAMRRSGAGAPELRSPPPNLANPINLVNPAPRCRN